MSTCCVVGIQDEGWSGLSDAARAALSEARLVVGAGRTLELVAARLHPDCRRENLDGALGRVPAWIAEAAAAGRPSVVLASGDPLCHGIAGYLLDRIGADALRILPAPSALQLACARWKTPWQDLAIASVHGPDAGEWVSGAPPTHGLYGLLRALARHPRVVAFTSPANGPDRIARALLTAGYGEEVSISVASRLGRPDESVFRGLSLTEAAGRRFDHPSMVLIEAPAARSPFPCFGLEDADYCQRSPEKGLITKQEVRAVSLARLGLRRDSVVWDIGAGSGSVGLEASRIADHGHVWAIEKNAADAANARENARRLRAGNYTLVEAHAPEGLDAWPDPDAVFIGGSGGELPALIALILARLKPGGRLVINLVTLENLALATAALAAAGQPWQLVQLAAARSAPILDMHRLAAENPVWILSTAKESPCPPTAV